ncbi:MAG: replication initiator protein [Microviridae sp.]|nr:MAG: replication initiator protein [Microviridae sp.]
MCLYPKLIKNRKYQANKKNKGIIPAMTDPRTAFVPVPCGKCMECMKQRANAWRIRLIEEIKVNKNGKFVTMTFSEESLNELDKAVQEAAAKNIVELNKETGRKYKPVEITGYELDNEIATLAVRRFLERWRKRYGVSVRHWLVTELGQEKTERLHIHGVIWTDVNKNKVEEIWKYGNVNKREKNWEDNYCNEQTISYIVKYLNKADEIHREYKPITLCSPGIGANYIKDTDARRHQFKGNETKQDYINRQGYKLALPTYYRKKIYNDEEREALWINLLDKEERWVNGIKVDVSQDNKDYERVLEHARRINKILGYADDKKNWNRTEYERQRRNIKRYTRMKKDENQKKKFLGGKSND